MIATDVIIAFDLDGTLIDSARDLAESISELVRELRRARRCRCRRSWTMVGDGAPMLVRRALEQSGLESAAGRRARALHADLRSPADGSHRRRTTASPRASRCALRRGPLAVLTNKPLGPSIGILEALGLRGFFTRIIGGDSEYGRKPDPAGLLALQALAPGDPIVMVGDSPADWKTAEAASVPFVFARYGFGASKFGSTPPNTAFVIDHARELIACSIAVRLRRTLI